MPEFTVTIKEKTLSFTTTNKVFSPAGLDKGTAAMLSLVSFEPEDRVLDLGCGYGPVGILAASLLSPEQVTMCDNSCIALLLSEQNAKANGVFEGLTIRKSDGLSAIEERNFTKILSNPPYHTDFSVAKGFIEQGYKHLLPGGMLYMVTKRKEWYKNKIISVFGGVHIKEIDGYFIFSAEKRQRIQRTAPKDSTSRSETTDTSRSGPSLPPQCGPRGSLLLHKDEVSYVTKKRDSAPAQNLSRKLARKQARQKH